MRKTQRKLRLHKETIRNLQPYELKEVNGGTTILICLTIWLTTSIDDTVCDWTETSGGLDPCGGGGTDQCNPDYPNP